MTKNYWGFRIDSRFISFFRNELFNGRLRIGWGWETGQDLRNITVDAGAKQNLPIYNRVKKGDILIVPHLPSFGEVVIAEATEDFKTGYKFEISKEYGDYGHIFPAKFVKSFVRQNENVSGDIRRSLKFKRRFWNMNAYSDDIDRLIECESDNLKNQQSKKIRYDNVIHDAFFDNFDENRFSEKIYTEMNKQFTNEEWEFALVAGLQKMLPTPINVERTGGKSEKKHGCDIMIHYPGIMDDEYVIGIQIKDYDDVVGSLAVNQVSKADDFFEDNENVKLIDKYVIITKAKRKNNANLEKYAKQNNVKVIFADELKVLLCNMGKAAMGLELQENS